MFVIALLTMMTLFYHATAFSAMGEVWQGYQPNYTYCRAVIAPDGVHKLDCSDGRVLDLAEAAGDQDQDGIKDYWDNCPDTPTEAAVTWEGCSRDSDGDGVADYKDPCPDTRTRQGDSSCAGACGGCPVLPLHVQSSGFKTARAELTGPMRKDLRRVAELTRYGKDVRELVVIGHTDSRATEAYNQALSEERAQSAAQLLRDLGFDSSKISLKGFGETQPIASNRTPLGQKQNRRIELRNPQCDVETGRFID